MMTMFKITKKDSRIALMNVIPESHSQQTFACSKSTIGTLEKSFEICSKVTIFRFEHISHPFVVFYSLTLNK